MSTTVSMRQREIRRPSAGTAHHDPRYLAIRWKPGITPEAKAALLKDNDLLPAAAGLENRRPLLNVNHTEGLSWVESKHCGDAVGEEIVRRLERSEHVAWVALAFVDGAGGAPFAVNPTRLYLSQQAVAVSGSVHALNAGLVPDEERPSRIPGWIALKVAGASTAEGNTAVEAALAAEQSVRALDAESGGRLVRFESIPFYSPTCEAGDGLTYPDDGVADDSTPAGQWGIHRAAITQARQLARPTADVTVAVIDTGVELNHPGLRVHPQSWNASDNRPDGGPTGAHGTACAGLVSAASGHDGDGAGAAPGVRLMSIATATWSDTDIAEGLHFAAEHGARVVCMGFGVYETWRAWDMGLVREALEYAHRRGLLLVAAAGNENIPRVRFPGNDPRTLCVGGSNRSEERKHILDDSSEKWWGACYGPDLDVVAPCLEMATTDRLAGEGYSRDDYYDGFNGTSSATALVAGLAGLLLTIDPQLSSRQVRRLIEGTCGRISPARYRYSRRETKPAGSWNSEVGYGGINALRALQTVQRTKGEGTETSSLCGKGTLEESPAGGPRPSPHESGECMLFYESCVIDSANLGARRRLQFRITYEHSLRPVGRQQGPLLYTATLLPGEKIRLDEPDRHRRAHSIDGLADRHAGFREMLGAVTKSRLVTTPPAGCLGNPDGTRPGQSSAASVRAQHMGYRRWPENYETTLAGGASVRSVCEAFTQSAITASQAIAAERSVAISTWQGDVPVDGAALELHNRSSQPVTYHIWCVDEVCESSSRVVSIHWRTSGEPWRKVDDPGGLPTELRGLFSYTVTKLPPVGETVHGGRPIFLPTYRTCCTSRRHPAPVKGAFSRGRDMPAST